MFTEGAYIVTRAERQTLAHQVINQGIKPTLTITDCRVLAL